MFQAFSLLSGAKSVRNPREMVNGATVVGEVLVRSCKGPTSPSFFSLPSDYRAVLLPLFVFLTVRQEQLKLF